MRMYQISEDKFKVGGIVYTKGEFVIVTVENEGKEETHEGVITEVYTNCFDMQCHDYITTIWSGDFKKII